MCQNIPQTKRTSSGLLQAAGMALILIVMTGLHGLAFAGPLKQRTFASPQKATAALAQAVRGNNTQELLRILGPGCSDLITSGDAVQDRQHREIFSKAFEENNRLEKKKNGSYTLVIGKDDWPLPFPIVRLKRQWRFDSKAGRTEVLWRHIGENELSAIQVCLAIADAQREYANLMGEMNKQPEYAQKFESTKEQKDGLYWEVEPGEKSSPLGPLVARAHAEGYSEAVGKSMPYHGYLYKILTAQGENANGGAHGYIINGKMIGGFAIIAFPASYGSSGVNTFIVNHEGVVYRKDLRKDTAKIAMAMTEFNPDATWKKGE